MKRRDFISMMIGAAAAPMLLMPNRSIFLPPLGGWPQVPIASFIIPKWLIGDYAEGLAKGHFSYDEVTETMSLLKHDPERAQVDGKFHSTSTGRVYDFHIDETPGARAAIDDALDKPLATFQTTDRLVWQMQYPALALPHSQFGKNTDFGRAPDDHEARAMERVRADAIALGIPFIGETYVIDDEQWMKSEHYRKWWVVELLRVRA